MPHNRDMGGPPKSLQSWRAHLPPRAAWGSLIGASVACSITPHNVVDAFRARDVKNVGDFCDVMGNIALVTGQ